MIVIGIIISSAFPAMLGLCPGIVPKNSVWFLDYFMVLLLGQAWVLHY